CDQRHAGADRTLRQDRRHLRGARRRRALLLRSDRGESDGAFQRALIRPGDVCMMRTSTRSNLGRAVPSWLLVALLALVALALSPTFRTSGNFSNLLRQLGPLALAALAQSIVFIAGGIDLSIGAVIGLTTV